MNVDPTIVWFLIGLSCVVLEFAAPGIVLIFFGLGAWLTAGVTFFGAASGLGAQLIWFGSSSMLGLLLLRRFFRSWFRGFSVDRDLRSNLDDFAGREVFVTSAASSSGPATVEFRGVPWEARAVDGGMLFEGQRAHISRVDGLCLWIETETPEHRKEEQHD